MDGIYAGTSMLGAVIALIERMAEVRMIVSDGGAGFAKALKKNWPNAN